MSADLPLIKNVLRPLAKSVLIPLGLTAAASATDVNFPKNESGTTALIISNKELVDIMKIVKSLEESDVLVKRTCETIKSETNEEKGGFLGISLAALANILLGNLKYLEKE